ncbi:MAG: AAA family ATPase [Nitrospira sp.]|nr:AAA family ATPase [Nitrospira sp.]
MIRAEYLRFLKALNNGGVAADVRKIANLVLQHLNTLIPLSTAQGQRIKKMAKLAQTNWSSVSSEIQPPSKQVAEQTCPIAQLKRLTVGPFRGFAKQEDFDLATQLVLIYGPNGTGKSSFCEALEYGLLGNVAEADSKRFRNQHDYFKNAHTKSFTPPILVGEDNQGNEIIISANETLYRFCFVEKNRIDNFSRIAAQAPSKQSELISTLFGLDVFTEFVRNFTDTMDGRYIDLEGVKAKELNEKRQTLAGHQQQLKTTIPEELRSIEDEEKVLASEYREGCVFIQMVTELNGSENNVGLIKRLEDDLQKPIASKSNVTIAGLQMLKQSIETEIGERNTKQAELSKASQQVSFKQLYESVKKLKESSPEQCPACQTPLSQVRVNPFDHADAELIKLQHLGQVQEEVMRLEGDIGTSLIKLSEIIKTCCSRFPENNQLSVFQTAAGNTAATDRWNSFHQQLSDGFTPWQHAEAQVKQLEDVDNQIDKAEQKRTEKQSELGRLREFSKQIVKLQTRRETANSSKKNAEEAIGKFDTENAQLIADVEAEKATIVQNQAISRAYATFVQKLNAYKNGLPAQLVANLGETVVQLYNAFNRYDAKNEQLSIVRLPLQQNQRLEIAFKNDPATFFDALHILSEGHIRCLGFAILAAKNIKENCPLLIFDDPVNAIDDEHRHAIRETLFVDDYFIRKQLIIAVHGEEFFNRTHQIIGKEAAKKAFSYLFSPRDDHHIRVNSLNRPKNYVLAARELYDTGEYRDSLMSARRALENLSEKAWFHYGKHCDNSDSPISVSRRAPNQPWDLRGLADNLRSKINKSKGDIPNKGQIVNSLSDVLGTDATQPPWIYLNKGTHDETDLPEFDQQTVNQIVTALERLDAALG